MNGSGEHETGKKAKSKAPPSKTEDGAPGKCRTYGIRNLEECTENGGRFGLSPGELTVNESGG